MSFRLLLSSLLAFLGSFLHCNAQEPDLYETVTFMNSYLSSDSDPLRVHNSRNLELKLGGRGEARTIIPLKRINQNYSVRQNGAVFELSCTTADCIRVLESGVLSTEVLYRRNSVTLFVKRDQSRAMERALNHIFEKFVGKKEDPFQ